MLGGPALRRRKQMNKTAIITGASAGIGRALALEMAKRGYRLGLTARREGKLCDLRAEITRANADAQVEIAALDVCGSGIPASFAELDARLGGLDVVVANAGINDFTRVGRGDAERERAIIETNLLGAMATVDAAVALFRKQGSGHVVGISSLAALRPIPRQAAYCASKAALSMYLDAAREELSGKNIKVTTILPGFIKTEIMEDIGKYPFAVSAEQCAREIADCIERGKPVGIVPRMPWSVLTPLIRHAPARMLRALR